MAPRTKNQMLVEYRQEIAYRPEADVGQFEYHPHKSRKVNKLGHGRPRKRPSIHDPGILEKISARIISGDGILSIMDDDDYEFPTRREFYKETCYNPTSRFSLGIRLAREAAHFALNDVMRHLVDQIDADNVNAIKAKLDWFKWHLGNLYPEIYGDKRQIKFDNESSKKVIDLSEDEFAEIAQRIRDDI